MLLKIIMTIKGIWKLYRSKVGFETLPLSKLAGTLVAIDAFSILYENRSVAKTRYLRNFNPFSCQVDEEAIDSVWLDMLFKTIIGYMSCGVTPVLVFDSLSNDSLKVPTLRSRTATVDCYSNKLQGLLDAYKDIDPDLVPNNVISDANSLLAYINLMPSTSVGKAKRMCKTIGVPYVFCNGEGERTCSLMNNAGIVSAIISPDSDSLCCGAQLVLKEKCDVQVGNSNEKGYKAARLSSFLEYLSLDFDTFQDLCIMSGTDFNENIRGISLIKSHNLLKKHGSFEEICKVKDCTILNRDEVKKRFAIIPWEETVKTCCLEYGLSEEGSFELFGIDIHRDTYERLRDECIRLRKQALNLDN